MPNDSAVLHQLRERGGAASTAWLAESGIGPSQIGAAVASGRVVAVRRGWYAAADASPEVVRAVRVGGALTGESVARLRGVQVPDSTVLHVRVPRTASRLRSPEASTRLIRLDPTTHDVCVHYRSEPAIVRAADPLPLALAELARCGDPDDTITAVDSALASGALAIAGLAELRVLATDRGRRVLAGVSVGSESGIETTVRRLLRRWRIRHRTQVWIPSVGRVDLLVGDRLVLEVDGSEFHSGDREFENDRRRDFEIAMRGYLVVRLSYRMVVEHWDVTSRGILALVERGEHRWGSRARPSDGIGVAMPGLDRIDDAGPEAWPSWD